jgi:hypothetical protein
MIKFFKMSLAAAFLLTAAPVVAPQAGSEAQARPAHTKAWGKKKAKRHYAKRHYSKRGKYQYQYVPNANGRPGAWR